jgi:hypothetical protein
MLHNTSNLNGGMWSSMAVGDVSCWLSFAFFVIYVL